MGVKKEVWTNSLFYAVFADLARGYSEVFAVLPRGVRGPNIVEVLLSN